ncbi:MAG: Gfo/Idh/MocA family oxidoreductase [Candidatus Sumerlaeia bacterium]|nr:Gfo/Idh/MocA family oxidoreductase [Candidatus Sumerlaeia bacterium]
MSQELTRRGFVRKAAGIAAGTATALTAKSYAAAARRKFGPNDGINVGVIGVGGRGSGLLGQALDLSAKGGVQVIAVCDVYQRRLTRARQRAKSAKAFMDFEEMLDMPDLDAVIIATPDHWHAPIAIAAMKKGKDVYCEKPMTHTVEEAKEMLKVARETGAVVQVGSQTTSQDQWHKAKQAIADGMLGKLIMSQGSYHRNNIEGQWNWPIDADAGPTAKGEGFINWRKWLGPAPERPYDADRFFRFRKYWDYSGGIATDLFYHVIAPMTLCWGKPEFPIRVVGTGGIWAFHDRDVPDTFMLCADYPSGHSLVLSSSMANDTHIPGLIRGHEATMMLVEHGKFEGKTDEITVTAQDCFRDQFIKKWGKDKIVLRTEPREGHMENWLRCIRERSTPVCSVEIGYAAMAVIDLACRSYRNGKVYAYDPVKEEVVDHPLPVKA